MQDHCPNQSTQGKHADKQTQRTCDNIKHQMKHGNGKGASKQHTENTTTNALNIHKIKETIEHRIQIKHKTNEQTTKQNQTDNTEQTYTNKAEERKRNAHG